MPGEGLATPVRAIILTMTRPRLCMLLAVSALVSMFPVAASASLASPDTLAIKSLASPALQSFT